MARKQRRPAPRRSSERSKPAVRRRVRPARRPPVRADVIRIVPLHYPKPNLTIDDLAALKAPGDLYDGRPRPAPTTAKLTYRNGPLLTAARVAVVFWGGSWSTAASAGALRAQIDQFFGYILSSALIDQLSEYNVPGQSIGHGAYLGSSVRTDAAPVGSVTDAALRSQLQKWIGAGVVPARTPTSLYFVYLEPGIVSVMGGSKSCQNYCGYHDAVGNVYYAVMPYPSCAGCLGGLAVLDALTATSSHELCESITDPVPGTGWYDDVNGEIGDICAWNFKKLGAYTVQQEWSNAQARCV
jgi:hypothetical protein